MAKKAGRWMAAEPETEQSEEPFREGEEEQEDENDEVIDPQDVD